MKTKLSVIDSAKFNNDGIFNESIKQLSPYRCEKIMRRKMRNDKNMSLAAGILLNEELKKYGLSEKKMEYRIGEQGKLYFKNLPELHFNISHSGGIVICAFSDCEVGCDVEKIRCVDLKLAKRFFSENEYEYIISQRGDNEKYSAFFRIWTLRESYMKAIGSGISMSLGSFEIKLDEKIGVIDNRSDGRYYFKEYDNVNGYKISCCCEHNNFEDNPLIS